ncbi:hypothetical protein COOONC_12423 [Cooperia oncophora]
MFQLEEESFVSVPALVNFYKSHRRPITAASGCIISKPVSDDRAIGLILDGKELEASYMHVLKPHMSQIPQPRTLSQRVLLNQTALRQYAAARQQRPKSSISQHQISVAPETVLVPPVPAALINRPLPLPIRSPRNTQEEEEDYSEMDYDAMDGILDASSLSSYERTRSSSTSSIPNVMSRQFQSCQNLSYRSHSPCTTAAKIPPPLPVRPPLPPRPNFKMDTSTMVDEVELEHSQSEDARDSAFVDYDEPRTKLTDDDYDKVGTIIEMRGHVVAGMCQVIQVPQANITAIYNLGRIIRAQRTVSQRWPYHLSFQSFATLGATCRLMHYF